MIKSMTSRDQTMYSKIAASLVSLSLLTACGEPKLMITNQKTGVSGTGTATGATFSSLGQISLKADGEDYNGTWVAMRDPGSATLSFWSPGPKDSGVGIATLSGPSGKHMRCEFSYNLTSLSGIGLCRSSTGGQYDLMMSM